MSHRAIVDPNKDRVFISLGIPMYNELKKGHLVKTIENALAIGVDDIVILDDGSDDGSWDVLSEYASKYDHIRIYRNEQNSVLCEGNNRWKFIVDRIAEKRPDWVVIRAADQIYSYVATVEGGDQFRKRLTKFYHDGVEMVQIPLAHMWRSNTWYRADHVWGRDIRTHSKRPIWRFSPKYNYKGREKTGTHRGWHHPNYFGFKAPLKKRDINTCKMSEWDLVVIHLGHDTHKSKALKFEWSMEAARANAKNGRSSTMPPPEKMPPVKQWINDRSGKNDGYKGFYEFNMEFSQAPEAWFPPGTDFSEEPPIPESLYETIKKYNVRRAEEYKMLYDKCYVINREKRISPPVRIVETLIDPTSKYEGELS